MAFQASGSSDCAMFASSRLSQVLSTVCCKAVTLLLVSRVKLLTFDKGGSNFLVQIPTKRRNQKQVVTDLLLNLFQLGDACLRHG